jgi:hypothetical protein
MIALKIVGVVGGVIVAGVLVYIMVEKLLPTKKINPRRVRNFSQ